MNVLLIHPSCGFLAVPQSAPLGLMSIATYLKQHGCPVRVYDRNVEKLSIEEVIRQFRPDAVGLAVITMIHLRDGVAVSRQFRKEEIPVIWGGHMATSIPEMVLREDAADYVVLGEGEITFYELLRAIEGKGDTAQIKGVAYKDPSGVVRRTPEREFADLMDFPIINWSLIDPRKHFAPRVGCKKMLFLYSSKGCPGRCAFCFNEGYHRCKWRKRPNEYVISEIKELVSKHGLDGVYFADEMFGLNKKEMYDLCNRLRDLEPRIIWGCDTRLGHMNRDDLQLMYDSGCRWIYYGVESGSPEMLERIHKGIDLETIDRDIAYCREIGISSHCGIIIGLPDETEAQLRNSTRLLLRLDPNFVAAVPFLPMPGSEFWNELLDSGRLTPPQTLEEWADVVPHTGLFANFSNVPARDLRVVQSFFFWRSFFRKNTQKGASRYEFAFDTIAVSLRHIFQQGLFNMIKYVFSSGKLFLTIAWYAHAYPAIRKKYGLYAKKRASHFVKEIAK